MSADLIKIPNIRFSLKVPFSLDELKVFLACESLRKKEDWKEKVLKGEISQKWKQEAIWQHGFASDLADWMISKLEWEASNPIPSHQGSTIEPTASPGVFQSLDLISSDLSKVIHDSFCNLLDSIPPQKRDYHPGTDGKVLNLLHPSLFPFLQDRTPLFNLSEKLQIEEKEEFEVNSAFLKAINSRNQAKTCNAVDSDFSLFQDSNSVKVKFQWIPTDFFVSSQYDAKCLGYINNLHPQKNTPSGELYPLLETVFSKFVPLFEAVLSNGPVAPTLTHEPWSWRYDPERPDYISDEEDEAFDDRMEYWRDNARFVPPKVEAFQNPQIGIYKLINKNLQVIFKIASVELTPEKPEFEGGNWHVEGTQREKICATGIYYLENKNITLPTLSFRAAIEDDNYDSLTPMNDYNQNEHEHLTEIYGQSNEDPRISYLNSVQTEGGKCIAFPNGLQHKLSKFRLEDPTKPGHRRFLVFFLVDPTQRIPSTTEIPPQQSGWIYQEIERQKGTLLSKLPSEIRQVIYAYTDEASTEEANKMLDPDAKKDLDSVPFMSHQEALKLRLELMEERSNHDVLVEKAINRETWSFCEH